jgi:antitoxin component of MazEF toxin-antitoxin module
MEEYTLTKQISKQGTQSVIIIPAILREKLRPKTLVEIKIKILDGGDEE